MNFFTRLFHRLFSRPFSADEQKQVLEEIFKGPHSLKIQRELENLSKKISRMPEFKEESE